MKSPLENASNAVEYAFAITRAWCRTSRTEVRTPSLATSATTIAATEVVNELETAVT